jgi:precorrin-2 dehydrogenase / sirohydrochlorin ferrochelatase
MGSKEERLPLPETKLKIAAGLAGLTGVTSLAEGPTQTQLYPVMFTAAFFANRPVLVVGGGRVAERKVTALLQAGARLRVIAPALTPGLRKLTANHRGVEWLARPWSEGDVGNFPAALLVFAATDNPVINEQVAREARENGRLVNRADRPTACDFTLPGVVQSGEITLTVSTGRYKADSEEEAGASPALTASLRKKLAEAVGPEYSVFSRLLRELRPQVRQKISRTRRPLLWRRMSDSAALELLRQGREAEARRVLEDLIREET